MQIGNLTSSDLAILLSWMPRLFAEGQEARELLQQKQDEVFSSEYPKPAWCHFYELTQQQHFGSAVVAFGLEDELKKLAKSKNQIQVLAEILQGVDSDDSEPTEEDMKLLRPMAGQIFAWTESIIRSLRSLMTFGFYMNDLIALVRGGGSRADWALLSAVKIDPTVLGCPSVISRMSRAVMLDDQKFIAKVRRAMNGKLTKREQSTYQEIRLILQVLLEAGAPKLSSDDLYALFHEELNLVRGEAGDGDVKNALRQFAYQFIKQRAVS